MLRIRTEGFDKLQRKLAALNDPKKLRQANTKGIKAAGKVIIKVAKAKAPRQTPRRITSVFGIERQQPLWKSFFTMVKTKRGLTTGYVGPRIPKGKGKADKFAAYHHSFLESGATRRKRGTIRPMKYLQRAYETTKNQSLKAMLDAIEQWFIKQSR